MSFVRTVYAPKTQIARIIGTKSASRNLSSQARPSNVQESDFPQPSETLQGKPVKKAKSPPPPSLTWPEYLAIRRSKHRWEMVTTFPSGLVGLGSGAIYFGSLETDPMKPIFGFDPFMAYGFLTVGCFGVGLLAGPTIGGALWRFTHRHQVQMIDEKDREFHHRIAKNRVDASLQSPTAPVPDYYGEKIGSLHQYRQWMRDQGKYRRKALLPETED